MEKTMSWPGEDFNALKFNAIPDISKLKEDLILKVLRKHLSRVPTNEDLLKVKILYSANSEELEYDNLSLGKFEIAFENNNEDFLRNNFRVVCNFKPYKPISSTFQIIT